MNEGLWNQGEIYVYPLSEMVFFSMLHYEERLYNDVILNIQ